MLRGRYVHRDGTDLHVLDIGGPGPPVVALHGLAGSAREFLPTAKALGHRYRVLLVDQRGHGHSTRRPVDTSREAFVADTVAVIERCAGGAPARLVGQSMGAHTAFLVAAARPDLVERLVLLEGHPGGDGPENAARLRDFFASWPVPFRDHAAARDHLGGGPLAEAWVADLERTDDGLRPRFDADVMGAVAAGSVSDRWAAWESLTVPTSAVFAEHGMFSEDQRREAVLRGPAVRRVDLPGVGHDAHLEAPEAWARTLIDLL